MGLVDEVVPHEQTTERAMAKAAELAAGAVVAQGLAKRAIDRGLDITLNGGLDLEQQLFADVFGTDDARIGVPSFLENGPGRSEENTSETQSLMRISDAVIRVKQKTTYSKQTT